uniref:6-phosphogluconolactonase n=1 Tax=Panagrolaimus sp. JU765 TaxID=591449 RepID=A0AC34QS13_9BILA
MAFPKRSNIIVAETKTDMIMLIREMLVKSLELSKKPISIGLSGGSMVTVMAPVILQLTKTQFDKLRLFCVDERLVPLNSDESNTGSYLQILTDEFKNKFIPIKDFTDAKKAADDFENRLREWKVEETSNGLPKFDFLFLGLGPDGHTCSLFPNHPLLNYSGPSWIVPIEDSPKPPPRRITITLPVCNAAKQVVFIATGSGKAELVKKLILEKDDSFPAGMVKPETPIKWFLDPEAGQHLDIEVTRV